MTDLAPHPARIIVVTASDSRFFLFLKGMLTSLPSGTDNRPVSVACFDLGLNAEHKAWLEGRGVRIAVPHAHLGVNASTVPLAHLSFLARPFLPNYFPDFDVYVWIDSDIWLQDADVLNVYVDGALSHGMAITHESTRAYRFQAWLLAWTTKHFLKGYGAAQTAWLLTRPHLNAGFFAVAHDAPHWAAWANCYRDAIRRTRALVPHDQFALNQALHGSFWGRGALKACLLPPGYNWICDRGIPMWNDTAGLFCEPVAPYAPIGALHLAGPAKTTSYCIKRTQGGTFETCIIRGAAPAAPCVSPLTHA